MIKAGKLGGSLTVKPKGRFLRYLREREPGRTQKEVEDATGLPNLRLSMYERGTSIPLDHLEKLALYYGMPARELIMHESFVCTLKLTQRLFKVLDLTQSELSNGLEEAVVEEVPS